ncbi:hypothetical protein JOF56_007959 [Kibdelosporangium banguiense]|uniref:Uncharacterized protein n=1 Tax=Kibdelosporangium banguiense TaxID=1365924 RepID=A0ABS4TT50_9PSEU|nr:hypothetical protein [Kibdelosporangium banguiense]MBP2327574.1 hypothetical protein [Kibdelosporangium banguiense]
MPPSLTDLDAIRTVAAGESLLSAGSPSRLFAVDQAGLALALTAIDLLAWPQTTCASGMRASRPIPSGAR